MLLHFKLVLFSVIYLCGATFMILCPPRNFKMSGAKIRSLRSVTNEFAYSHYLSSTDVFKIASKMADNTPDLVRLIQLKPSTSKNRTIIAIELQSDKNTKKPGLLIVGGLDPMVWSAPNAILELAQKLLYDASYQTPFFNDYDWYLIPTSNPDGLELTQNLRNNPEVAASFWSRNVSIQQSTRPDEWHKSTQKENGQACFGTNINRNFPYHWQDDVNKAPDHCSQYYSGPKPFSAPEAKAIRQYVDHLGDTIEMAIHLHASYIPKKEMILYPWRFSQRQHSNYEVLQYIGEYAARQSRLPDGRLYEVHQSSMEGQVAGSLTDYLTGVVGTDLVYILKPYHTFYPNFTDNEPREINSAKKGGLVQWHYTYENDNKVQQRYAWPACEWVTAQHYEALRYLTPQRARHSLGVPPRHIVGELRLTWSSAEIVNCSLSLQVK